MLLSRNTLVLLKEEDDVFFIQDTSSFEIFKFDKQEYFLFQALSKPYNETVLVAKYNAKFSEKISLPELRDFIDKLADLGLFEEESPSLGENLPDKINVSTSRAVERSANPAALVSTVKPSSHINTTQTQQEQASEVTQPSQNFRLFCPQVLLDHLLSWFHAFSLLKRLIPIIFVVSLIGFFINIDKFSTDLQVVKTNISFLGHIIFTLFTTNLITQTFRGAVARSFHLETPGFGIIVVFGLLPRFNIQVDIPDDTPKLARLWVAAAPIYMLLTLFSVATILWLTFRGQGTALSYVGAGLALVSIISFLFVANPLMGGAGSQLISEYYDSPHLRKDAFRALRYLFFKPPEVVRKYAKDSTGLRMYGLFSVLFLVLFIVFIGAGLAKWLRLHYSGLGISVFALLVIYLVQRFYIQFTGHKNKPLGGSVNFSAKQKTSPGAGKKRGILHKLRGRYLVYILITLSMFLPYQYESGGTAEMFPVSIQEIYVEYSGVSNTVHYNGGEWLLQGTVIAEMDNERQLRDVDVTKAEISKKQEEIGLLLTTPLKEDVAVAEQSLVIANLRLKYSKENLKRIKTLHDKKYVSFDAFQNAYELMEIDGQESVEKEIQLRAIKNQVNLHLIESLRIELGILERELVYFQKVLADTQLTMPIDGRIITMNLQNKSNKYYNNGDLFAIVEDSRKMRVEILVPESDINEIAVGSPINLRLQAFPGQTIEGRLTEIYPTATEGAVGNIVKVVGLIDNQDHFLKTGMTGYAKIESREMFVIEAFSRALVRFVQVEAWSWLP